MTFAKLELLVDNYMAECKDKLISKGRAYSGDKNALASLYEQANDWGLAPSQVAGIFLNKHLHCIKHAIARRPAAPEDPTEGLRGRIVDAINFLLLLAAILDEIDHPEATP